ncbi:MAG: hypothetical protein LBV06_09745 [Propionibacteriaceae bacterium]|jgi:phosphoglycerate dehydrogenase-like enzyme|nr:hypothetical protein [Propionibacteriaceae bacterium]
MSATTPEPPPFHNPLTAEELDRPVYLGPLIDDNAEVTLRGAGVVTTRDPDGAVVVISSRIRDIPPTAKWMHCPFMGVDSLVGRLPDHIQLLTRTITGMPERMASYVATMVWAERWKLHQFDLQQTDRKWVQLQPDLRERDPRGVVILGTGQVGSAAARALHHDFPFIWGVSRSGAATAGFDLVVDMTSALDGAVDSALPGSTTTSLAWKQVDTVVITFPRTPETTNLVSHQLLDALHDAHVILIGRGATMDFSALEAAVASGSVRHATIDVLPAEPAPPQSWLWTEPRVTLTPHISGSTQPSDLTTSFHDARQALLTGAVPAGWVQLGAAY